MKFKPGDPAKFLRSEFTPSHLEKYIDTEVTVVECIGPPNMRMVKMALAYGALPDDAVWYRIETFDGKILGASENYLEPITRPGVGSWEELTDKLKFDMRKTQCKSEPITSK